MFKFNVRGVAAIVVALSLLAAVALAHGCGKPAAEKEPATVTDTQAQVYTCPMHPDVVSDKPGKCPTCGMNLVPKAETGTAATAETGK